MRDRSSTSSGATGGPPTWSSRRTLTGAVVAEGSFGRTRKEVAEKLHTLQADAASGVDLVAGRMTVGELFDEFDRLGIADTVAPQTRSAYRWSLDAMRPALGAKRLGELKVAHIEAMLSAMVEGGAARASIARHRSTLRRALRWAQRRE